MNKAKVLDGLHLRALEDFPIRGDAWFTEINGHCFVIWHGRYSGNQDVAIVYETGKNGRPLAWVELFQRRTLREAVSTLKSLASTWPAKVAAGEN